MLASINRSRNVYYIKEQSDGTWVPGTIISDGSVQVVSFSEDINVSRPLQFLELWRSSGLEFHP